MDSAATLKELQADFLAGSSTSMPLVGTIYWLIVGIASLYLPLNTVAYIVLIGSGMILPGGLLLDKLRYGGKPKAGDPRNPLMAMFIKGTAVVVLTWPLVIIAAQAAGDPGIIVLGGAVLMALVWIPYGSAANDPVGLQHAVGRSIACYLAFWLAPVPYKAAAVSAVVVASYLFTFLRMKRPA
ncbi:MAG: hypothetical protein EAY70_12450 [Sphingomonadales bacterium]|nr:MAG: hypothetical protein EAY70_12450 [Sphingomonadales bacterium]